MINQDSMNRRTLPMRLFLGLVLVLSSLLWSKVAELEHTNLPISQHLITTDLPLPCLHLERRSHDEGMVWTGSKRVWRFAL
jgi:hypothetical protein